MGHKPPPEQRLLPHVLYQEADRLGIITLDRPEKLNALTNETAQGVADSVEQATASAQVICVEQTGMPVIGVAKSIQRLLLLDTSASSR